jgi:hypothetical protein
MASRCAFVMRGNTKPLAVDHNSNKLEAWGLVVPIPTLPLPSILINSVREPLLPCPNAMADAALPVKICSSKL